MKRSSRIVILICCAMLGISCAMDKIESVSSPRLMAPPPTHALTHAPMDRYHHAFMIWPVDRARLTQRFHPRRSRPHLGIDLAAPRGTHIFAATDGIVIYAGHGFHGYGRMIIIRKNQVWSTLYAHMERLLVYDGEMVHQGQVIGLMGATGYATGVHLHFEVRDHLDPINPLLVLPGGQNLLR